MSCPPKMVLEIRSRDAEYDAWHRGPWSRRALENAWNGSCCLGSARWESIVAVSHKLHTISIGQSTHWDLVKKSGLQRILFVRSCLRRILFFKKSGFRRIFLIQIFLKPRCIWFEDSYYVYQFIGGENDSNSNTEWSQRHILYLTVIKKVSNNKPFVKSNLWKYKSHNTISIPQSLWETTYSRGNASPKAYSSDMTKHSDYFV